MKSKILIKLTSLTVSFALCLSALPLGKFDIKTYGKIPLVTTKIYDYKSIKDLFSDVKDPDSFISSLNEQHEKNNSLISKVVFSTGAAVIVAKLTWNLYRIYKENKNTTKKGVKKKHTDKKRFWTKIKDNLGVFKDKFLVYTALITLGANLLIRCINDHLYSLKEKEIKEGKDIYFAMLYSLFENLHNVNKVYILYFCDIDPNIRFPQYLKICKGVMPAEKEKLKFEKDSKKIIEEIRKILTENGMDPSKVGIYYSDGKLNITKK